ncbi:MAG TPA: extracellular solute-binding protein, partial [Spirochaetota bacterium]|nr:extracellular solute-binding protein [Spirochaetota bacterium]
MVMGLNLGLNAQKNIEITGSGATFPEPLYKKMFDEYNKSTGTKVNYQGIGSGGGIKQL